MNHSARYPLPRGFVNAGQLSSKGLQSKLVPTQTKLANHSTSAAGSRTTVLDRRRPRVATEGVELELRLVAHLGGESLVACDVEVCAAQDLVVGDALSRFNVAQDAYFRSGRHSGGNVEGGKTNKPQ